MWFSKMVLERSNCLKSLAAHKIFLQGDGRGGLCFWHDFNDSTSLKAVCYSILLLPSPIAQRQSTRLLIEGLLVRIQLGERMEPRPTGRGFLLCCGWHGPRSLLQQA